MKSKKEKRVSFIISIIVLIVTAVIYIANKPTDLPDYAVEQNDRNTAYVVVNDNIPEFSENEHITQSFEFYSELDAYGRCGYAVACIGVDIMPKEDRESISEVKPSGWNQRSYEFVEGKSLYNRCHLIGFQLTGENANERNLITGTRYLNVNGMLPFENMVSDYVKETENHVLYRVTPDFRTGEMVARGVKMEAFSVEDNGEGICFNVYVNNIQPGVVINYTDGSSYAENDGVSPTESTTNSENTSGSEISYILNLKGMKFHLSTCKQGQNIQTENRKKFSGDRNELINQGYVPAGCCNP